MQATDSQISQASELVATSAEKQKCSSSWISTENIWPVAVTLLKEQSDDRTGWKQTDRKRNKGKHPAQFTDTLPADQSRSRSENMHTLIGPELGGRLEYVLSVFKNERMNDSWTLPSLARAAPASFLRHRGLKSSGRAGWEHTAAALASTSWSSCSADASSAVIRAPRAFTESRGNRKSPSYRDRHTVSWRALLISHNTM